jgi:hypothetical protein
MIRARAGVRAVRAAQTPAVAGADRRPFDLVPGVQEGTMQPRTYSLGHWEDRSGHRLTWKFGYRGTAGEFGGVEVVYPASRRGDRHVTEVRGDTVPSWAGPTDESPRST